MHKKVVRLIAIFFIIAMAYYADAENVSVLTAQRVAQSFFNSKMGGNPKIHLAIITKQCSLPKT